MENNKINFFKRFKIAIFNLEEYGKFIEEKLSVAIKYLLIILLFSSIVVATMTTYDLSQEIKKGVSYLENEFPEFTFEDSQLNVENYVEGYDDEYDLKLIVDTDPLLTEEKKSEYIKESKNYTSSILVFNNKIIYCLEELQNEYLFTDISQIFNLQSSNKAELLNKYKEIGGIKTIATTYLISMSLTFFITNVIEVAADCLIVALVGIIVARLCGIMMRSRVAISLSIYSLTLSLVCNILYAIVYNFFGFEIKYFQVMYLMIAYVYIIAAILIIKTDLMKQAQELMKIQEIEKEVKKEFEEEPKEENEKKQKEEDKKEDDKKDDDKTKGDSEGKNKDDTKAPNIEPKGSQI